MISRITAALVLAVCLGAAEAQDRTNAATPLDAAARLDDVLVLARRPGAPMWTVSAGDSTLILVGGIAGIPRDVRWRPDDLQIAAARADRVLTPQEGRASLADVLRVIWRARTLARLPQGRSTGDYLSPYHQARLEIVMAPERTETWPSQSLLILGFNLLKDRAGYSAGRSGLDPVDAVRKPARRAGGAGPACRRCWWR